MQPSKKPRNLAICNDVDETRGYYAERNKSIREDRFEEMRTANFYKQRNTKKIRQ